MSPRHLGLLALGVLAVSSSAILIRLADAPPLAVALYRNGMAAAVLLPLALLRHRVELRTLSPRHRRIALVSGGMLALHFALWVPSLALTTVAASTVLVTTGPVWVAVIGRILFGDRVSRRVLIGIGLSLVGAVVITGGDLGTSPRALLGDLLALGGAIAAAGYMLAGRRLRPHVSLPTYTGVVYAIAAVLIGAAAVASGSQVTGFEPTVWLLFVLMTIGPQILGHTVFNYLLAHVEAAVVAIAVTAEPVGASLLALLLFVEAPTITQMIGGVIILVGIYVAISAQTRAELEAPVE